MAHPCYGTPFLHTLHAMRKTPELNFSRSSFVRLPPHSLHGHLGISKRHHGALASNVAFGDPPACLLTHPDDDALQATPGGPAHPSCGHSYHI